MKNIINIIKEEVHKILHETYEDVGIDYIKNDAKKLNDYNDYQDKKTINGITYVNFVSTYGDDWFIWNEIKAFDNTDGTEVGNASYGKAKETDILKASVDVRPDKRRLGIASNMYKWIEELTKEKLRPDVPHSQLAAKFWSNPKRTFGYDK
jgi:GNAT superfamily N-acetyltransferase